MATTTTIPADPANIEQTDRRTTESWRQYLAPGTNTLANKAGLTDPRQAEQYERTMTTRRLADLPRTPHTPVGYKSIHKHLFQDVYEWAGQTRTVEMHRSERQPDGSVRQDAFIPTRFIGQGLATTFGDLKPALDRLRQEAKKPPEERNVELVAKVAASHVGALNFVHAFRDGNGRTMRRRWTTSPRRPAYASTSRRWTAQRGTAAATRSTATRRTSPPLPARSAPPSNPVSGRLNASKPSPAASSRRTFHATPETCRGRGRSATTASVTDI